MNGFNDKGLQAVWDGLGLPADIRMQEEFERMVCEWAEERIVRCKDCKHSTEEGITEECYFCHLYRWNTNPVEASPVEPDGFCKWGERK